MQRRITETCPELRNHLSYNETGDLCCGSTICGKELRIVAECDELFDGEETGYSYQVLACGHSRLVHKQTWETRPTRQLNKLWNWLLPKQKTVVEFIEQSGLHCYLVHDTGCGKTVTSNSAVRENIDRMHKVVFIVQPGDIYRWREECMKWLGVGQSQESFALWPQVFNNDSVVLSPNMNIVIVGWSRITSKKLQKQLEEQNYCSVVVDEGHLFKSEGSARTQALQKILKICRANSKRILNRDDCPQIWLSATPVMNRIAEWFVPLNALRPQRFPSRYSLDRLCMHDSRGKATIIDPYFRESFFKEISSYVDRRTREEMEIPLPKRNEDEIHWFSPYDWASNKEFIIGYNSVLDKLQEELNQRRPDCGAIMGFMSQLRQFTGMMKVLDIADYARNFLELYPKEKLCIGIHHKSVRNWLMTLLAEYNPLSMSDESAEVKDEIEKQFMLPESRLLICSILGAGQGRNLQFCRNSLIAERQWNREKETQFKGRFWRPLTDKEGRIRTTFTDADTVSNGYLMAKDSFDEYFDDLVHLKGAIVDSGDSSVEEVPEEETILMLAERVVQKRMKYVGI